MSKQAKRERQRLNREARRQYEISWHRRRRVLRAVRMVAIIAVPLVAVGVFLAVSGEEETSAAERVGCREIRRQPAARETTFPEAPPLTIDATATYTATVDTSCGSFTIQLAATEAPNTVNSFVFLAREGFYDGLTFHRVPRDFVVQGGDPAGDGSGGPGYTLPDEPPADGYLQGSVAMANSGPGTTGSQFFVVTTEEGAAGLNQQVNEAGAFSYSILGQVTEGFETIEKINRLGSRSDDLSKQQPRSIVLIDKVTITEAPAAPPTS